MRQIPDTNQRACYSETAVMTCTAFPCNADGSPEFCGQDAQYGWDTLNQASARFARNTSTANQPVVTDSVTGLVWQGCAAGLSGDACATGSAEYKDWAAAKSYCADLTWGGHSDWVLPDVYQLRSIADYGCSSPSIDVTAFPATPSYVFWSSSSLADSVNFAFFVYFDMASSATSARATTSMCVVCVPDRLALWSFDTLIGISTWPISLSCLTASRAWSGRVARSDSAATPAPLAAPNTRTGSRRSPTARS